MAYDGWGLAATRGRGGARQRTKARLRPLGRPQMSVWLHSRGNKKRPAMSLERAALAREGAYVSGVVRSMARGSPDLRGNPLGDMSSWMLDAAIAVALPLSRMASRMTANAPSRNPRKM